MSHSIDLRYADDGNNPTNWQSRDAGNTGSFIKSLIWRRLGWTRERFWEFSDTSAYAAELLAVSIIMESE